MPLDQSAAPPDAETGERPRVSLLSIAVVFFGMGALSFGGGMTGWVYRTVVLKHGWLTDAEFIQALTVAQTLPGGTVANLTAYVGNLLRGIPGAAVGLFFLLLAPAVSVVVLFVFYQQIAQYPMVGVALEGVAAGAVGLLILMAWKTGSELKGSVAAATSASCRRSSSRRSRPMAGSPRASSRSISRSRVPRRDLGR